MRIFSSPRQFLCLIAAAAALIGVVPGASTQSRPSTAQATSYDLSSLPAASEYSTDVPKGHGFLGSESAVLGRSLVRINKALGTSLQPDNRLARLARWVYERFGTESSMPPQSALDLLTHHLGLPEPLPHMLMTYAPDAPRLANIVSARLARIFDLSEYTHIGGVAERVRGGVIVVIALSRRHIAMTPVPRSLTAPGRLSFEGNLLDGYARPELAHTLPNGETRFEELGKGPAFATSVDLTATGRHRLEIMAHGPGGPNVIVNFPVYVGVPVEGTVEAAPEPRRAPRPSEAQSRLFELINQERARAGLAALMFDPELSEAALRHSEDMRKNGFVGHVSPTSGSPEQRLLAAGIVTDMAAENVGRGYSPDEIHRGLMDSPGHRGAILHPGVTHAGIGISSERRRAFTDYLVTELFIRRIPQLGPDSKVLFLAELIAIRELSGGPALEEDPGLSGLAEESAREFLEKPELSQGDVMSRLQCRLEQGDLKVGTAAAVFSVVGSLKEGVERTAVDQKTGARAKRVGIGIAQGTRPGLVPNSIVLVLIFAE
jgi:uncharacterized protein YkwD